MNAPAKKSMGLNFSNTPVSAEAIEAALREKNAEVEKQRALAYAEDLQTCQIVVDRGIKTLKEMRAAVRQFEKEFKKLEEVASAKEFADVYATLSIRTKIGITAITLKADYPDAE